MSVESSAAPDQRPPVTANIHRDDDDLLILALNHSSAWLDARVNRGLQVINYLLLSMAILSTAYVSALNAKNYAIAAAVSILAGVFTIVAFLAVERQMRSASVARAAVAETQDRVATRLGIDSLRLANGGRTRRRRMSIIVFAVVLASCVASFIYPLTR